MQVIRVRYLCFDLEQVRRYTVVGIHTNDTRSSRNDSVVYEAQGCRG